MIRKNNLPHKETCTKKWCRVCHNKCERCGKKAILITIGDKEGWTCPDPIHRGTLIWGIPLITTTTNEEK